MRIDEVIKTSLSKLGTIRVKTALNPLLWLVGITLPFCVIGVALISDQLVRLLLLGLGAIPVLATLLAYAVLLFRDPDRLQSEEYMLQHEAMQELWRRGVDKPLDIASTEITTQAEALKRLEKDDKS